MEPPQDQLPSALVPPNISDTLPTPPSEEPVPKPTILPWPRIAYSISELIALKPTDPDVLLNTPKPNIKSQSRSNHIRQRSSLTLPKPTTTVTTGAIGSFRAKPTAFKVPSAVQSADLLTGCLASTGEVVTDKPALASSIITTTVEMPLVEKDADDIKDSEKPAEDIAEAKFEENESAGPIGLEKLKQLIDEAKELQKAEDQRLTAAKAHNYHKKRQSVTTSEAFVRSKSNRVKQTSGRKKLESQQVPELTDQSKTQSNETQPNSENEPFQTTVPKQEHPRHAGRYQDDILSFEGYKQTVKSQARQDKEGVKKENVPPETPKPPTYFPNVASPEENGPIQTPKPPTYFPNAASPKEEILPLAQEFQRLAFSESTAPDSPCTAVQEASRPAKQPSSPAPQTSRFPSKVPRSDYEAQQLFPAEQQFQEKLQRKENSVLFGTPAPMDDILPFADFQKANRERGKALQTQTVSQKPFYDSDIVRSGRSAVVNNENQLFKEFQNQQRQRGYTQAEAQAEAQLKAGAQQKTGKSRSRRHEQFHNQQRKLAETQAEPQEGGKPRSQRQAFRDFHSQEHNQGYSQAKFEDRLKVEAQIKAEIERQTQIQKEAEAQIQQYLIKKQKWDAKKARDQKIKCQEQLKHQQQEPEQTSALTEAQIDALFTAKVQAEADERVREYFAAKRRARQEAAELRALEEQEKAEAIATHRKRMSSRHDPAVFYEQPKVDFRARTIAQAQIYSGAQFQAETEYLASKREKDLDTQARELEAQIAAQIKANKAQAQRQAQQNRHRIPEPEFHKRETQSRGQPQHTRNVSAEGIPDFTRPYLGQSSQTAIDSKTAYGQRPQIPTRQNPTNFRDTPIGFGVPMGAVESNLFERFYPQSDPQKKQQLRAAAPLYPNEGQRQAMDNLNKVAEFERMLRRKTLPPRNDAIMDEQVGPMNEV